MKNVNGIKPDFYPEDVPWSAIVILWLFVMFICCFMFFKIDVYHLSQLQIQELTQTANISELKADGFSIIFQFHNPLK